jgi:uncharacterized protein (TIGR04255 family)
MPARRKQAPDGGLPEFERPPVAEVVLGIQFDPLVGMASAYLGAIWELFRDKFPHTVDQSPLTAVFERIDARPESHGIEVNLDLFRRPPLPRCWFISEDKAEVLQLQEDRFHHNWRRVDSGRRYPRYATIRRRFEAEAYRLSEFITEEQLGDFVPNQCEITYINHIVADGTLNEPQQAGRIFRSLTDGRIEPLGPQDHLRFETAFLIRDEEKTPRGRLHVSVVSGFLKEDSKPMFAMTLTARGAPMGEGLKGALGFLDLGHRWIVRGFAALTTDAMHGVWKRKQ